MTGLDDRGRSYEDKFAHDEEIAFKAKIKRDHMFAHWLADEAGAGDAARDHFVNVYAAAQINNADDAQIIQQAHDELQSRGVDISLHRLESKRAELLDAATEIAKKEG